MKFNSTAPKYHFVNSLESFGELLLVGDEPLELVVSPDVLLVEEDLRHRGLPRPLLEPLSDVRRESVHADLREGQVKLLEGGLGLGAMRTTHDGVDDDAALQRGGGAVRRRGHGVDGFLKRQWYI